MPKDQPRQPPLTVTQAAEWLNVKPGTVYALCAADKLRHSRIGLGRGTIRIELAALEALLRESEQKPKNEPTVTLSDLLAVVKRRKN